MKEAGVRNEKNIFIHYDYAAEKTRSHIRRRAFAVVFINSEKNIKLLNETVKVQPNRILTVFFIL